MSKNKARRLTVGTILLSLAALMTGCGGGGGGGGGSSSSSSGPSLLSTQNGTGTASSLDIPLGGASYPATSLQYEQYGVLTLTASGGTLTGTLSVYTPAQPTSATTPATPAPVFVTGSYPVTGAAASTFSETGTITLIGTPDSSVPLTVTGTLPTAAGGTTVTVSADGQTYSGTFNPQPAI